MLLRYSSKSVSVNVATRLDSVCYHVAKKSAVCGKIAAELGYEFQQWLTRRIGKN